MGMHIHLTIPPSGAWCCCSIQDIVEILSVLTGTAEASVGDACFLTTADLTSDGLVNSEWA